MLGTQCLSGVDQAFERILLVFRQGLDPMQPGQAGGSLQCVEGLSEPANRLGVSEIFLEGIEARVDALEDVLSFLLEALENLVIHHVVDGEFAILAGSTAVRPEALEESSVLLRYLFLKGREKLGIPRCISTDLSHQLLDELERAKLELAHLSETLGVGTDE